MQVLVFGILVVIHSVIWFFASSYNQNAAAIEASGESFGTNSLQDSFFIMSQVLISAGYETDIPDYNGLRVLYAWTIFQGLLIFSIFIAFVTEKVQSSMASLEMGEISKSKVTDTGHTLILGWNEATLRVVVQISFLRRQYQILNEMKTFGFLYYFPQLTPLFNFIGFLERPSTSLAHNDIVIMSDTVSKYVNMYE